MTKKRVNITMDPEIHEKAKRIGLNVSKVAENALLAALRKLEGDGEKPLFPEPKPQGDTSGRTEGKSKDEILAGYCKYAHSVLDKSEATVKQHTRYIKRLLNRTDNKPREVGEEDIIEYLESEKPMSRSKHQNVVSALRVFFREYVETDVAENFKIPSVGPTPTKVPSKDELQTFYKHLEGIRFRAMFLVYATSGLRSGEVLGLEMEDVDLDRRMLTPKSRSDTKRTWVSFYNEEAEKELQKFLPERKDGDDRLFQINKNQLNQGFGRASKASGIKITAPKLRKWFASEMATLGVT